MSINDDTGNEIIHLNAVWSASFKLLLLSVPFVGLTLFSWGTWVTLTIFDHNTQIKILEDRNHRNELSHLPRPKNEPSHESAQLSTSKPQT